MASNGDNKVTATTTTTTVVDNGVCGKDLSSTDENPKKIVDLNTAETDDAFIDDGEEVKGLSESGGEKKDETDSKVIGSADSGNVSPVDDDIQKKIRRAERFGVTVTLTEEEKRNSRAERFGTVAATVNGSEGTKKAEELKRKARADRFGVPATTTTSTTDKTEEEAKKKARLARFGNDTKANTKVDAKVVDSAEEDKRKARALRFSKPASDSSSDLTGKQDIVKEAAVSGNAA